ncbi:AAA family ATPase [Frigidibacter albus]|uniref:AAA family ATPase n=1 Tax=Frigidibacter albus TaxID=1465486 RepID=A0A6L8VN66_9RHOB|nr:ATP-binding protein [Frigidibacter albus]MZQ91261.1 AAA family ATPase [Frigidibacter albus]NBE33202.1 AAA family ATPase [Frigidibacter albus]GGH63766.1 hypothetical protein GCM10011341_39160 [Frigidibacter albus]
MNPFVIDTVVAAQSSVSDSHFPLQRATDLQHALATIFSRHLGNVRGGRRFESEGLLVTGQSGSGKTEEVDRLVNAFNASEAMMPSGMPARFVSCVLDGKVAWKELGRETLRGLGYPISDKSRATQVQIWRQVVVQAREQGVVGIYYDEAQHILRGKSDAECLAILDSFKTLMKSPQWPLMLILTGVPELAGQVKREPQLFRLINHVNFEDITPPDDYRIVHEMVSSYAIHARIELDADLTSFDFYDRLATAGAFRWGLVIQLTINAILEAAAQGATTLSREHFIKVWAMKTDVNEVAGPFLHPGYTTMFRKDRPFQVSLPT